MPRAARFEIAGVPQHVLQRGNNRCRTFLDDEDRCKYLHLAQRNSAKHGVAIHAYVLMGNHVHFLLTASQTGLCSGFMHDLGSMYVNWFNLRYGRTGSLWEGRFRNCIVDNRAYLWNCHRYIEFNPVRAGLAHDPGDYRWSSYAANANARLDRLITPRLEYLSLGRTAEERAAAYRTFVTHASCSEADAFARLRHGGVLGSAEFEASVAALQGHSFPPRPRGRPRKQEDFEK